MALTKYARERLSVPHEEGEWIEIKSRLSHWEMQRAKQIKAEEIRGGMLRAAEGMKAVQGAIESLLEDPEMKAIAAEQSRRKAEKTAGDAQLDDYDEWALLEAAIVDWSFTDDEKQAVAVGPESVRDIDPQTVQWLLGEIGRRNIIGREQGEGSAASSSGSSSSAA